MAKKRHSEKIDPSNTGNEDKVFGAIQRLTSSLGRNISLDELAIEVGGDKTMVYADVVALAKQGAVTIQSGKRRFIGIGQTRTVSADEYEEFKAWKASADRGLASGGHAEGGGGAGGKG